MRQYGGSILDADHPENGVNIPCRFTGEAFSASDFKINSNGICRLNPQLARRIVRLVEECVSEKAIVLARELLALVGLSLASKRGPRLDRA